MRFRRKKSGCTSGRLTCASVLMLLVGGAVSPHPSGQTVCCYAAAAAAAATTTAAAVAVISTQHCSACWTQAFSWTSQVCVCVVVRWCYHILGSSFCYFVVYTCTLRCTVCYLEPVVMYFKMSFFSLPFVLKHSMFCFLILIFFSILSF